MTQSAQCSLLLLRYVPDAVKDEFVNIGLVLRGPSGAEVRFTRDYSRAECMDPDLDVELLRALEADVRRIFAERDEAGMRRLVESLSNIIQITAPKGLLADDIAAEADKLARIYLETAPRLKDERWKRREPARRRIFYLMRDAFDAAGVWALMFKDIRASDYTHPGDPLRLDCGYKNGRVRLFHALNIEHATDAAKSLAYTWPTMRERIEQNEKKEAILAAVIADAAADADERVQFSLRTLEQVAIQVVPVSELGHHAELARAELKV